MTKLAVGRFTGPIKKGSTLGHASQISVCVPSKCMRPKKNTCVPSKCMHPKKYMRPIPKKYMRPIKVYASQKIFIPMPCSRANRATTKSNYLVLGSHLFQ